MTPPRQADQPSIYLGGVWQKRVVHGEPRFVGAIGDPLRIRVVVTFDSTDDNPVDFTEHTWLAEVRRSTTRPVIATFDLAEDNTAVADGVCTVDLTFDLDDTSVFADGVRYLYGVKAIVGALAPYVLIAKEPIYGYEVIPQE